MSGCHKINEEAILHKFYYHYKQQKIPHVYMYMYIYIWHATCTYLPLFPLSSIKSLSSSPQIFSQAFLVKEIKTMTPVYMYICTCTTYAIHACIYALTYLLTICHSCRSHRPPFHLGTVCEGKRESELVLCSDPTITRVWQLQSYFLLAVLFGVGQVLHNIPS